MEKILITTLLTLNATLAFAGNHSALSLPGYFGSINNNTGYVIECSQVIGGYCANNPMPANGYVQMLPDPGSTEIRGHIMAYSKTAPGHYTDNIVFTYTEQKNGLWKFNLNSLDNAVKIKFVTPDTVVLTKRDRK